ncbi:MAG: DUF3305 domain-containing protein [Pseudomonadota bacterium]
MADGTQDDLDAREIVVDLGVVVAHEVIEHAWQTEQVRPVSVFLDPPSFDGGWRELVRRDSVVHYHAGNVALTLHRKETAAYLVNLEQAEPAVFVVLEETEDDAAPHGVEVHSATLSPYDAEAYGDSGDEIVGAVAMPDELRALLEAFIGRHHVEEKFVKRKRNKARREEEDYQFGQEPIVELRKRMAGRGDAGGPRG